MSQAGTPAPERSSGPADGDSPILLIGCSPDRTLIARGHQLFKVYERGSMAEARAEARRGAVLRSVEGVVRYRGADHDEQTGRPCVVMDFHPGANLEQWLAQHGPFAPRIAGRLARRLARTLAAMHALRHPDAPHGVVHRDIKPANVFLPGEHIDPPAANVLLLDLEHSIPAGSHDDHPFTGGTHGFAPPEAYDGAVPTPAFDVFGFGATLHAMLCGQPPFEGADAEQVAAAVGRGRPGPRHLCLAGVPKTLVEIVLECLAANPADRPTMAEVHDRIKRLLSGTNGLDRRLDGVLASVYRGRLSRAAGLLEAIPPDASPRRQELVDLIARRSRLVERAPAPEAPTTGQRDPLQLAEQLIQQAPRVAAWLRRFPCSSEHLRTRQQLIELLDGLLIAAPRAAAADKRNAQFERAESALQATLRAVRAVAELPRGRSAEREARVPGPMDRDPERYLQLALDDLLRASGRHRELLAELSIAESGLDLNTAHDVVEQAAATYGGASAVVAGLKDRVHRLGFYLDRISHPTPAVDELREQLILAELELDLEPVLRFQRLCGERAAEHRLEGHTPRRSSLQALQRILHDLVTEFPHTRAAAAAAVTTLDGAMQMLTDFCWQLTENARRKLGSEPIPVRPLLSMVHRLDTLRRLEILVDRPERPRTDLIEEHERLRIEVEQARAARDRLARGAEEAMERGHWTTALFEMERAVDRFSGGTNDEPDTGSVKLVEQLEKARRRKDAIDQAASENMQLAARYADLQEDPQSNHAARVAVLQRRHKVLRFLASNLQAERVEPYRVDLAELELTIAQEHADHAEAMFDGAVDAVERERIARHTVATLQRDTEHCERVSRRLQRLIDRWERQFDRCQQELRLLSQERRDARRRHRRRRHLQLGAGAVVLLIAAATVTYFVGRGDAESLPTQLQRQLGERFAVHTTSAGASFDSASAYSALNQFRLQLAAGADPALAPLAAGAQEVVDSLRGVVNRGPDFELGIWASEFGAAMTSYDEAVTEPAATELQPHLARFRTRALEAGLFTAVVGRSTAEEKATLRGLVESLEFEQELRDEVERLLR